MNKNLAAVSKVKIDLFLAVFRDLIVVFFQKIAKDQEMM